MAVHEKCPECRSDYGEHEYGQNADGNGNNSGRRGSESTVQTGRASPTAIFNPYYTGRPRTPANGTKYYPVDRQEIIRRIKSGERKPTSPDLVRTSSSERVTRSVTPLSSTEVLLDQPPRALWKAEDNQSLGLQIERPRSALHRGDFREEEDRGSSFFQSRDTPDVEAAPPFSTSPVAPWHPDFPRAVFRQVRQERRIYPREQEASNSLNQRLQRSRAASHASLAASFVYKPPTSPLVQSSRPDTPEPGPRQTSRSPDKSRRHTFSPVSLHNFQSALKYSNPNGAYPHWQPPALRSEKTFPYQAHQPRRSLNSFASLPQTSTALCRRPSVSDSPLHHAPMVGSYEESILRGRMSTTPSKPLNFVAQIGVLGKGDCRPNLRCPPHASIPFPAVFYSYGSGSRGSATSDQPSPYVGLVDLEHNLPSADAVSDKRRQRLQINLSDEGSRASSRNREEGSASDPQAKKRRRQKQKRRSGSPKAPPGGSYRIPQQGQLQIIIKTPNKTAVKLFLVPYSLSDMEPGQKTFIRQRSYSAGPIVDMPLTSRRNLGTDRPEAAINASDDPNERPTLRYLIHLHICCPSKGRYFLYKSIRVVFANRVPDGKEKLRNEIQLPEPKYSTYKPGRDSNVGIGISHTTPRGTGRRQSLVDPSTPNQRPWTSNRPRNFLAHSLPTTDSEPSPFALPMQPVPAEFNGLPLLESRPASRQTNSDGIDIDSDRSHETLSLASRSAFSSPTSKHSNPTSPLFGVRKLEDPFTFPRDSSRERMSSGRSESLISRRLKDLAFQGQNQGGS